MVTVEIRELFAFQIGAFHLDDLRRPRFAGNFDYLRSRRASCPSRAFYNVRQATTDSLQRPGFNGNGSNLLGPILTDRSTVQRFDPVNQPWAVKRPAIRDRHHHIGELQGRYGEIALADCNRERFTRKPRLAESLFFPFAVGDDAALFVVESGSGLLSQTERACPFCDPIYADPLPGLVEIDVARLDDRLVQIDRAMSLFLPVAERPIAEVIKPRIGNAAFRLEHSFFQTSDG